MIYNIYNQNRNINFIGLAKLMGDLIAAENSNSEFQIENYWDIYDEKKTEKKYFFGDGKNKEALYDKVMSDDSLLLENAGQQWVSRALDTEKIKTTNKYYLRMPYVKEEVLYLKYIIKTGIIKFFFSEEECKKLEANIDKYLVENNIDLSEADKIAEFINNPGESKYKEDWNKIRDKFSVFKSIEKRIEYNRTGRIRAGFTYKSTFAGENKNMEVYPLEILYSQLEERIRVKVWIPAENRFERIYLSDVEDYKEYNSKTEIIIPKEKEYTILVAVNAVRNAYERFVGRILEYDYEFLDNPNKNLSDIYYIKIKFPEIDKYRMLNRLLSIGPYLRVIDEDKIINKVNKKSSTKWDESLIRNCGEEMKQMVLAELNKTLTE